MLIRCEGGPLSGRWITVDPGYSEYLFPEAGGEATVLTDETPTRLLLTQYNPPKIHKYKYQHERYGRRLQWTGVE
jgi:hypothetical protein